MQPGYLAFGWTAANCAAQPADPPFSSRNDVSSVHVLRSCQAYRKVVVWTEPALARSYLNCLTKKVVIVDAPSGSTSSSIEETLGFWIDETEKNASSTTKEGAATIIIGSGRCEIAASPAG